VVVLVVVAECVAFSVFAASEERIDDAVIAVETLHFRLRRCSCGRGGLPSAILCLAARIGARHDV
jgi:hypothetical protein